MAPIAPRAPGRPIPARAALVFCLTLLPAAAAFPTETEYGTVVARTWAWAAEYPDLVTTRTIGCSRSGRDLTVLRISASLSDDLPGVFVGASIHGGELSHRDLMVAVEGLLREARAPEVAELLRSHVLWVQPMINPDGVWATTRTDAAGVDLNRNFGFAWGENWQKPASPPPGVDRYAGPRGFSEPESCSLALFLAAHRSIVAFLDLHRSARVLLAPFGARGTELAPAEHRLGEDLTQAMGYEASRFMRIIDILPEGSGYSIDWVRGCLGVSAFTIEMADGEGVEAESGPALRAAILLLMCRSGRLTRGAWIPAPAIDPVAHR